MQMEILFKKSGISNPPDACIRDNPCLPKFGTLYGLCPNVEETRNPMQTSSRKKCSHFSQTNVPSAFSTEIPKCAFYNIPYRLKAAARPMQQSLLLQDKSLDHLGDRIVIVVVLRHIIRCGFHLRRGIFYRYPDMRRIKHCNIILLISHRYRTV